LKFKQIYYRVYYKLCQFLGLDKKYNALLSPSKIKGSQKIILKNFILSHTSYENNHSFSFLNQRHDFQDKIDWNWNGFGKLWTYNLNYFDFLMQANFQRETGFQLMLNFINQYQYIQDGHEAYPTSLRIINWIKFISQHNIESEIIDRSLFTDLTRLQKNIEYHIMGNHLLENGFSLLFGAFYFKDTQMLSKAESILKLELNEQVLNDGAHFELSPMYHQILLVKVLDCINLLSNNEFEGRSSILKLLKGKSRVMLGWLQNVTFSNGDIPHVNDSTYGISPSTEEIEVYAKKLSVEPINIELKECGYRMISKNGNEIFMDVGNIGPDYIPGHAHSDTLNFIFYHQGIPIIVDTGISTYEKNEKRQFERSTCAHNTVMINDREQSEIWGGFRVAKRAKGIILEETENTLIATHTGYDDLGIAHKRSFTFLDDAIRIHDGINSLSCATFYLHFHPNFSITIDDNTIKSTFGMIEIKGANSIESDEYLYSSGFNKSMPAVVVIIGFKQNLEITILPV